MFCLLCKCFDKFQIRQSDCLAKCIVFFCNLCKRYFCILSKFLTLTKFKFVNSVVVFLIEYNHIFAHPVLVQLCVPLKTTHIRLIEKAIFVIACIQKNPSFFILSSVEHTRLFQFCQHKNVAKKNFFLISQHKAITKKIPTRCIYIFLKKLRILPV